MAFSHGNVVHSETAKKEQIITEIFAKSLHVILESRAPYVSSRNSSISSPSSSSSSPSNHRARDKWFNLTLRECPDALKNIDFWRQSNLDPMVIDIILVQRVIHPQPTQTDGVTHFRDGGNTEKVIERWFVQYESRKSKDGSSRSKRSGANLLALYKNSVLLLRSLYATVRLLPAYKLFRELTSSGHIRNYTLTHRVNSFVEPFTHKEEADMAKFRFAALDTSPGQLRLSVLYHQTSVSDMIFEHLIPVSPRFILNYVDSPIVDRIKRFPSLPVSQSLPSYDSISRQHSWGYDVYHGFPPSILHSPATTYSESHAPLSNPRSHLPPMSLPHRMEERFRVNVMYDPLVENCPPGALVPSNAHPLRPSLPLKITKPGGKSEKSAGAGSSVGEKFSLGRDESGRFSAQRISSGSSPRLSISSRVSILDDFGDPGFVGHFVDDDDEMTDPGSGPRSFNPRKQPNDPYEPGGSGPARKSPDAALGTLILMLKRAPPLQRDCTNSTLTSSAAFKPDSILQRPEEPTTYSSMTSSGLALTKTTADALTELRKYSSIKEGLLGQGDPAASEILN